MAGVISSGIGSGLDIAGIVEQLIVAEGQPVESRLGLKESRAQSKLSAFGSVSSALSSMRDKLDTMRDLDNFLSRKASSGNEELFTVSAGAKALPASYDLEIVQTATSQKLASGAFTGADAVVGTGSLSIDVGASRMILEFTDANNTLADVRDAINLSADNPGLSATIVNADSGSYLILTADKTGAQNAITVTQAGGDGGLSALEYDPANSLLSMTESIPAGDALIRIDGLDVMSASNSFTGAVEGVTITVLAGTEGSTEVLRVENDVDATKKLVSEFVDSYNELIGTVDSLTSYDADSQRASALIGDSTIRSIRDQVRREMSTAVEDLDATFSVLSEVGLELQLDGKLSINDEKLDDVLANEFAKFGQLFSASDGFATRLYTLADGFLESDGIIESRTQGLTAQVEVISDQREALNDRLIALESRLLRQFNALDSLLANLSQTSNFLSQQLGNLPGAGQNNN